MVLLLTDRVSESSRLQQRLDQVAPCVVAALHQAAALPAGHAMIVCDVALDNIASVQLIRAALSHHRTVSEIPLLCLIRDPSQLTQAQAQSIGASAVLPCHTSDAELFSTIESLFARGRRRKAPNAQAQLELQADIQATSSVLTDLFDSAKRRQAIAPEALERGSDAVLKAITQAKIRAWLDVVWNFDEITYQHCLLVAGLVAAFARKLGLSLRHQQLLSQAALVHDIGKANIPLAILNKAGRLSPAETVVMRTHAAAGHEMLLGQRELDPLLPDVARHHHEYLDGSGYPDGLRGNQISSFVRLVTICDIYAALIERRAYKAPTGSEQAYGFLVDLGDKLDRGLVASFQRVIAET